MTCNQCCGIEDEFNREQAEKDLRSYHRNGPGKPTTWLIEALLQHGVGGGTLLDIGGGVGAIQYALLEAGLGQATHVDASSAYLQVARQEAQRLGLGERVSYYHGDFVTLADDVGAADFVTLDKVICCYDEMHALIERSAKKARRYIGLIYPRDRWWMRLFVKVFNIFYRMRRRHFRVFVHPSPEVERLLAENQLRKEFERRSSIWQVVVYAR